MIQREHRSGPYIIGCDTEGCNETSELEGDDFNYALKDAFRTGWKVRKRGGGWNYHCCTCSRER